MNKKGLTVYPPTCPRWADAQPLSSDSCVPDRGCSRGSGGGLGSLQYLARPTLPLAKTNLLINTIWDRGELTMILSLCIYMCLRIFFPLWVCGRHIVFITCIWRVCAPQVCNFKLLQCLGSTEAHVYLPAHVWRAMGTGVCYIHL
jgi:hypothetical protein